MPRFLNWFLAFIESLFNPKGFFVRSRVEAEHLKMRSIGIVNTQASGFISCPWHQERGTASCKFNKTTRVVQCSGCHRTTDIQGLWKRLESAGVYERAVE